MYGGTSRHFHNSNAQITLFDKCVELHKQEHDKLGEWSDSWLTYRVNNVFLLSSIVERLPASCLLS